MKKETKDTNKNQDATSLSDLATSAGTTACSVYGVVGLLDEKSVSSPSNKILNFLKKEDFAHGVSIKKTKLGYELSLYVVCSKDIKIAEVVYEIQKQVMYSLKRKYKIDIKCCNVFIVGLK